MGVTAIPGWVREYLGKAPGRVADLESAEHFAIQQTLARYAFALDQHDLAALEQLLTGSATWTFSVAPDLGQVLGVTGGAVRWPAGTGVRGSGFAH
jgi:hypothetical protein